MANSANLESIPNEDTKTVQISARSLTLTRKDSVKDVLTFYEKYLRGCTSLCEQSIIFHVRILKELVQLAVGEELPDTVTGGFVTKILCEMDDRKGFLSTKKAAGCTASYIRKMIQSCFKLLEWLESSTNEQYRISEDAVKDTTKHLRSMLGNVFPWFACCLCIYISY